MPKKITCHCVTSMQPRPLWAFTGAVDTDLSLFLTQHPHRPVPQDDGNLMQSEFLISLQAHILPLKHCQEVFPVRTALKLFITELKIA